MKPNEIYAYQTAVELIIICLLIMAVITGYVILTMPPAPPEAPPVVESVVIEEIIEATPIPTPTLSKEQWMEQSGGLKLGAWLSTTRLNVSGYKDISLHTTVYRAFFHNSVEVWSVSWGRYFREGVEGKKALFVLVNTYTDEGSARMWGLDDGNYWLDVNGTLYQASKIIPPEVRIHELDEVWDLNHVSNVQPYGYLRAYTKEKVPVAYALGWLKAGKSNAWDGYIMYVVPQDTRMEDCKVIVITDNLMQSHWWQLE